MKLTLRKAILALALGIASISIAAAQDTAPAIPDISSIQQKSIQLGLVDTANLVPNFAAFGAGFKSGQNLNGVSGICHAVAALDFLCAESKFSGPTTSNTVSIKHVLVAKQGFLLLANGNVGVATGANGGSGAAYALGGSTLYEISRLPILRGAPGYYLGVSAEWDKRNVSDFIASARAGSVGQLRPFASQGTYTFFVGKAWK